MEGAAVYLDEVSGREGIAGDLRVAGGGAIRIILRSTIRHVSKKLLSPASPFVDFNRRGASRCI
eukprot:8118576-Pyramimonas_sp.AAC.1